MFTKSILVSISLLITSAVLAQESHSPPLRGDANRVPYALEIKEADVFFDCACLEDVSGELEGFGAGVYVKDGEAYRALEVWLIIEVPKEVKENVSPPEWIRNWEDMEFAGAGYDTEHMLGKDERNLTLRAAYHILSVAGGVWLDSSLENKRSDEFDQEVLRWFYADDEDLLRQIHVKLGF